MKQQSLKIDLPHGVRSICTTVHAAGFQIYVVGGAVRDSLIGRPVHEWDLATSATPEQVTTLFRKVIPTGLAHGTVTVLTADSEPVEVTTLRLDGSYADGRHPDEVIYTDDLQQDLKRRDFTINAMAWDPISGTLHDPFKGQEDLAMRMIRCVGKPADRFREDGLRPLRAVRFAAQLEFALAEDVLQAIPETLDITRKVAVERLRDEFMKTLGARKPSTGLRLFKTTGLLALLVPELLEGVGIEQNEFHAHDVFEHSLNACDASEGPALLRLAVLLHDIAKPRTRKFLKGAYRFYGHDLVGAKMTAAILKRLRFSNDDTAYVVNLVEHHMFYYREEWTDAAVRRFIKKVGTDQLEDLLKLRIADEKGSGVNAPDYARLDKLRARIDNLKQMPLTLHTRQLAINGNDVMRELALKPSPEVGKILNELLEKVLDEPSLNEREQLLTLLRNRP